MPTDAGNATGLLYLCPGELYCIIRKRSSINCTNASAKTEIADMMLRG